jgi:Rps23 Pro-64 3,4-dihydroxylase Tpa1-like proline 4-hydroxylase
MVCGYPKLEGDRQFTGAGMQRYHRGGFSEIHLDSNRHPFDSGLHHRVNLLVFLNPNWQAEWGGELVLWSRKNGKPDQPRVNIQPTFNRAVLFTVTSKSWHSVNKVRCPGDQARNSIAIYYFNRFDAAGDEKPRSVIWHSTHGWPRQAVFEVTNRVITFAKPHARYLRWLRSNKFDGVFT